MKKFVMVAGPHGAGKTKFMQGAVGRTFAEETTIWDPQNIYDHLKKWYARKVDPKIERPDFTERAREKVYSLQFEMIRKERNITAVSSLGRVEDLDLLDAAHANNYHISFYYLGIRSPQLSAERVKTAQDHWVKNLSSERLTNNYLRSLAMLSGAVPYADEGIIYDNSKRTARRELLHIQNGKVKVVTHDLPGWILEPLSRCV